LQNNYSENREIKKKI